MMLAERFPGRFLLGLGASHRAVVERLMGQEYGSPLAVMSAYLDDIDTTIERHRTRPAVPPSRLLAALGPKMLELAARRSSGAHTYMAPVEHTRWARQTLGPSPLLSPAIKVVLSDDRGRSREVARWSVGSTLRSPAYRSNLRRFGFSGEELIGHLSDRVVDALVACGDESAAVDRVREHLDAGADHVCVEVLTGDDTTAPMDAWRRLAPALIEIR
jgi:probable F420-dependent oxidoreductase